MERRESANHITSLDYYAIEHLLRDDERANAVARAQALGLRVLAIIRQRRGESAVLSAEARETKVPLCSIAWRSKKRCGSSCEGCQKSSGETSGGVSICCKAT